LAGHARGAQKEVRRAHRRARGAQKEVKNMPKDVVARTPSKPRIGPVSIALEMSRTRKIHSPKPKNKEKAWDWEKEISVAIEALSAEKALTGLAPTIAQSVVLYCARHSPLTEMTPGNAPEIGVETKEMPENQGNHAATAS